MADTFGRTEGRGLGGADKWDDGLAGQILLQDYFSAAPSGPAIYLGAGSRATRYLGSRSDAQIYLGTGTLFP